MGSKAQGTVPVEEEDWEYEESSRERGKGKERTCTLPPQGRSLVCKGREADSAPDSAQAALIPYAVRYQLDES